MSKSKYKWVKKTLPLPAGHRWKCKDGNNLFIADRGAVMFEMPKGWVVRNDKPDTMTLHDRPPPDDTARISMTVFHLPPVKGGWGGLPLEQMLTTSALAQQSKSENDAVAPIEAHRVPRSDVELVWTERPAWIDPENGRRIRCRMILARARLVQVLLTVDVYEDHWAAYEPSWDDLLRSLRVAVPVDLVGEVGN